MKGLDFKRPHRLTLNYTRHALFVAPLLILTMSCQTTAQEPKDAVNAVLTNPSDITRQEITKTISNALNGRKVTIAADSFTSTSLGIIEKRQLIGPDGLPVMGRDYEKPDHFILKANSKACWLYHTQTDTHYPLKTVLCRPEA